MKKLYVTGIAGLLGASIVSELKTVYKICGSDKVDLDIGMQYDVIDLLDFELLKKSIKNNAPDVIIHTAAMVQVDLCEQREEEARMMNTELTKYLAELCKEYSIKLIYISTDAVFDGKEERLYVEEDKVNPVNIYGKTKLAGEKYVLDCPEGLVLRTNLYGLNIQDKNSFGEWVVKSLQQGKSLKMFEDISFSPILTNDLAIVIGKAVEKNINGLYHACASGGITKYDFGVNVKKVFGLTRGEIIRSKSSEVEFLAQRSPNMCMSNNKICQALGIALPTPEESVKRFYCLYMQKEEECHGEKN